MNQLTETVECPLCLGEGKLKRTEVLERLGVGDFARVAQLSAEEAFRLLQHKHGNESQQLWARFEAELTKRAAESELRHRSELQALAVQNDSLNRRVEDSLREVVQLRERNQELEIALSKTSRVGKLQEADFADEARSWAGISIERVSRNGDFILAYRDSSGAALEPRMLIDNKDKTIVSRELTSISLFAMRGNVPYPSPCSSLAPRISFDRWTGRLDGAARTGSGY